MRVGRFKIPRGLYNEVQDYDALRTSIMLPQSVYNVRLRDFYAGMNGAQLYGRRDAKAVGAFTYQACIGNNNYDVENGGVAYYFNNAFTNVIQGVPIPGYSKAKYTTTSLQSDYIMAGSLGWESTFGLRLGVSGCSTRGLTNEGYYTVPTGAATPVGAATTNVYSGATVNDWRSFVFSAEYVLDDLTVAAEITQESLYFPQEVSNDTKSGGGYLSASYRFTSKLEIGSYFSHYIADLTDRHGDAKQSDANPNND